MRGAPISPRRFSALPASPARGGSTTTTSGLAAPLAQLLERLADVAGEERRVADPVQVGVLERARDRLLRDLDPPHRERVAREHEPDRPDPAVQVEDGLVARSARRTRARSRTAAPPSRVFVCRNAFGRTRKRRPHSSSSIASSPQSSCVGRFVHLRRRVVHRPVDRPHLRERRSVSTKPPVSNFSPGRGDELHEHLARVAPFAHDEVAQVAGVLRLVVRDRACPRAPSRAPRCGSRCRGRSSASTRSISSTSSQRPALWKPERRPVFGLRERVLELVAVVEDLLRREDRLERRLREPADAAQRVGDLRLLRLDLRLVGEILEAAAAAGRVVRARRVDAQRRRARGPRWRAPRRGGAAPSSRARGPCPRKPAPDEHDEAVQARDAVPAVRERVDRELELLVLRDGRGHEGPAYSGCARQPLDAPPADGPDGSSGKRRPGRPSPSRPAGGDRSRCRRAARPARGAP